MDVLVGVVETISVVEGELTLVQGASDELM